MKKSKLALIMGLGGCALSATLLAFAFSGYSNVKAKAVGVEDLFVFENIKYKTSQSVPVSDKYSYTDHRRGLLLYGYENGIKADLVNSYSDTFSFQAKAFTQTASSAELQKFSLVFDNALSEETFSLCVEYSAETTNVYVSTSAGNAGLMSNTYDGGLHGYTTAANNNGVYTQTFEGIATELVFEPSTMQTFVSDENGMLKLVWDLTQTVMDGKAYDCTLSPMELYNVSITFDNIKKNGKGELLVYEINGVSFADKYLSDAQSTIYADFSVNAIVNESYKLPAPIVSSIDKNLGAADVLVQVYNEQGTPLLGDLGTKYNESLSFTPNMAGEYYVKYSLGADGASSIYKHISAYNAQDVRSEMIYAEEIADTTVGKMQEIFLPEAVFTSNLMNTTTPVAVTLSVKKDGVIVDGFNGVEPACTLQCQEVGEYVVTYTAEDYAYSESFVFTVSDDLLNVALEGKLDGFSVGDTFVMPTAVAYQNAKQENLTVALRAPDGELLTEESVVLSDVGVYTVVCTNTAGDVLKEENIYVEYSANDLWIADKAEISYGQSNYHSEISGAIMTFTGGGSVTYGRTIDLSDNTKPNSKQGTGATPLLSLFVQPQRQGASDMTGYYIELIDKENPENLLSIRVRQGTGNATSAAFIRAQAPGQSYAAWYYGWPDWNGNEAVTVENSQVHDAGGFLTDGSFTAEVGQYDFKERIFQIWYDYEEKALYGWDSQKGLNCKRKVEKVADFDDPKLFPLAWDGFSSGEVELRIRPYGVASKAQIILLDVDGTDFTTQKVADSIAPELLIDIPYENGKPPVAKVNTPYPLFASTATDRLCREVFVKTEVFVGVNAVEIKDGAFVPTVTGDYKLRYTARDSFGNITVKEVTVNAQRRVNAPTLAFAEGVEIPEEAAYMERVELPSMEERLVLRNFVVGNGVGAESYQTMAVAPDGTEAFIEDNVFVGEMEGIYTLKFIVKDYIGQTGVLSKTVKVTRSNAPVFNEKLISLPPAFVDGHSYCFDKYVGEYFKAVNANGEEVEAKIIVTDDGGTREIGKDKMYVPVIVQERDVTVQFIFNGEENYEITKTVKGLKILDTEEEFMKKFFLTENATLSAGNYLEVVGQNNADIRLEYCKEISVHSFLLELDNDGFKEFGTNFDGVKITLRDVRNQSISVAFDIRRMGENIACAINDGIAKRMSGSFTQENKGSIVLRYNNATKSIQDYMKAELGTVEDTLAGKPFAGFTSNEVYMTVEVYGVRGEVKLNLKKINNQNLDFSEMDMGEPEVIIHGSYSGQFPLGSTITLPTASAYDVLHETTVPVLSVTDAQGNAVVALDGTVLKNAPANVTYQIAPQALGQYKVEYLAYDTSSEENSTVMIRNIVIYDDILPELILKNTIKEEIKAGQEYKLPKYELKDNVNSQTVKLHIYIVDPNGEMTVVEGNKIILQMKGMHYIHYLLEDEQGNFNLYTFAVKGI